MGHNTVTDNRPAPDRDCALCPRLADFRHAWREKEPEWFNAPVPSFGPDDARLLIVGLAPGVRGANRTGRPFTGDYAGDLLYATLEKFGFARGRYGSHADDGLELVDCRITNAARCVPPENKPTGPEVRACAVYLSPEMLAQPRPRVVVALGSVAHTAILSCLQIRKADWRFGHGALHRLPDGPILADSYHCSRYNTNTGRLTTEMFESVFRMVRTLVDELP